MFRLFAMGSPLMFQIRGGGVLIILSLVGSNSCFVHPDSARSMYNGISSLPLTSFVQLLKQVCLCLAKTVGARISSKLNLQKLNGGTFGKILYQHIKSFSSKLQTSKPGLILHQNTSKACFFQLCLHQNIPKACFFRSCLDAAQVLVRYYFFDEFYKHVGLLGCCLIVLGYWF